MQDMDLIKIINNKPEEMPEDMAICFIGCRNDACDDCDGVCMWG